MKNLLLFITIGILSIDLWSQKEGNIWYFGNNAGISFSSGSPTALTDGQISTREGCASIADNYGNLLFYTDGQKVYDASHNLMVNGSNLLGHVSSCQSALIIPWPGNYSKYFIISVDAIENNAVNGVRYSVVDMSLNSGKGDIVSSQKNIVLLKPQCEKATLIPHSNKTDYWLVTNQSSSDSILSFAITSTGINKKAIRSNSGLVLKGDLNNNLGYLNPSHDGSRLVSCHFQLNKVLLMDFDNSTGKISNSIILIKACAYSAEFSPNNKVLYVSGLRWPTSIDQFDISSTSQSTIQKSIKQIFDYGSGEMGALKLAPDGLIYATSETTTNNYNEHLGAIKNPNTLGINCSFNPKAVYLGGKGTRLGLPNIIYQTSSSDSKVKNTNIDIKLNVYPNPLSNSANIEYITYNHSDNILKILNILGDEISTVISANQEPGTHYLTIDTSNFESGTYFIELEIEGKTTIKKVIIIK